MNLLKKLKNFQDRLQEGFLPITVIRDDDKKISGSLREVGDDYIVIKVGNVTNSAIHLIPRERIRSIET